MRILFDENVQKRLRKELGGFEIFTVKEMSWSGIKNGKLLQKMYEHEFDCLITYDKRLIYQQNLETLKIKVLVLNINSNNFQNALKLVPKIIYTLNNLNAEKIYIISE